MIRFKAIYSRVLSPVIYTPWSPRVENSDTLTHTHTYHRHRCFALYAGTEEAAHFKLKVSWQSATSHLHYSVIVCSGWCSCSAYSERVELSSVCYFSGRHAGCCFDWGRTRTRIRVWTDEVSGIIVSLTTACFTDLGQGRVSEHFWPIGLRHTSAYF